MSIASRVAAKFLQAEEQQQGQQQQEAMPKSQVGQKMIAEILDKMEEALESGNQKEFHDLLEKLNKAAP